MEESGHTSDGCYVGGWCGIINGKNVYMKIITINIVNIYTSKTVKYLNL